MRYLLFGLLLLFSFCGSNDAKKKITEGQVDYTIEYLTTPKQNALVSVLPRKVSMKFKNNNTSIRIEGLMDMFEFAYITLYNEKRNYTILRIFSESHVYEGNFGDIAFGYVPLDDIDFMSSWDKKDICGLECYKVTAKFGDRKFPVYYTKDLGIELPNTNNPFNEIDGVLMQFDVLLNNIEMRMTASNVIETSIDDSEFSLPKNHRKVTLQQLDSIVNTFSKAMK